MEVCDLSLANAIEVTLGIRKDQQIVDFDDILIFFSN